MRRSGLEYSQSSNMQKSLDETRAAIDRIHQNLDLTWSDQINKNTHDTDLQLQNRLRRLESAYLETRLALRHAYDDESRVLLFVLGAKLMHDIAEQSERYSLPTVIDNPVPESSNLREASLAWLNRGVVIATIQDDPSSLSDIAVQKVEWQSPAGSGSRREQLDEALSLAAQYGRELEQIQTPLRAVDDVELAA